MRKSKTVEERFWKKVDQSGGPDACWEWTAQTNRGYGQFKVAVRTLAAHRVAYELYYGVTPSGRTVVCHSCDNTRCCNPHHLMLSSQKANIVDAERKGRMCHNSPRMPDDAVRQAHQMRLAGLGMTSISTVLGLPRCTIQKWLNGDRRRDIYEEFYGAGAA